MNSLLKFEPWSQFQAFDRMFDLIGDVPSLVYPVDGIITLRLDLPGFKIEDIRLESDGQSVRVQAENKQRTITRTWQLGQRVDLDKAQAKLELGELVITLPARNRYRTIEIKAT